MKQSNFPPEACQNLCSQCYVLWFKIQKYTSCLAGWQPVAVQDLLEIAGFFLLLLNFWFLITGSNFQWVKRILNKTPPTFAAATCFYFSLFLPQDPCSAPLELSLIANVKSK